MDRSGPGYFGLRIYTNSKPLFMRTLLNMATAPACAMKNSKNTNNFKIKFENASLFYSTLGKIPTASYISEDKRFESLCYLVFNCFECHVN